MAGAAQSNKRMSSIARSINLEFWLREFSHLLLLDIVLVAVVCICFFLWRESVVPDDLQIADRYFIHKNGWENLQYVIETEGGRKFSYALGEVLAFLRIPAIVLLSTEGLFLFGNFFSTGMVRRKMRPLNDVAMRMEELVSQTGGQRPNVEGRVNLSGIEQAISQLNPELPDARVETGNQELQSLEIAINNLLERMRESYRQQERFVSDASHELRTPIAVIQGYVNMLDRWGKDDEQILQESIEALKNESEQMKILVEQLLFLARGDSGRNTLHVEEVNLTETVREVMDESAMIDERHVYAFSAPQDDVPIVVFGDLAMLKQSMRIFVQNAAKYSAAGDTITLAAGLTEDNQPYYSVQDEGVGMAASEVVHVFERFYRSDSARSSAEGGTGLGLSIAKWIVDAHGGVIEILSRPEFGTRITVKL